MGMSLNEKIVMALAPEVCFFIVVLTLSVTCTRWVTYSNFLLPMRLVLIIYFTILVITLFYSWDNTSEVATAAIVQDVSTKRLKVLFLIGSLPLILVVAQTTRVGLHFFTGFLSLFMYSVLCFLLLISVEDFIVVYALLEIQFILLFIMAGLDRSLPSLTLSISFIISWAVFSAFVIFGSSEIFTQTGSLNLEEINYNIKRGLVSEGDIRLWMIFLGSVVSVSFLVFKLGVALFVRYYEVKKYDGAPLVSVISITIIPKTALLYVSCRLLHDFAKVIELYQDLLVIFALTIILFSTGFASKQKGIRKIVVHCSLSAVGFLILALATNSFWGFTSIYLFLYGYIIGSTLIWSLLVSYYSDQEDISAFYTEEIRPLFIVSLDSKVRTIIQLLVVFSFFLLIGGVVFCLGSTGTFWRLIDLLVRNYVLILSAGATATLFFYFYYLKVIKVLVVEIKKSTSVKGELQPELTDELMDAYHSLMVVGVFLFFFFSYVEPAAFFI